ncbi:hypothetical protein FOBRF1_014759 [Fusarium oxysporum]
MACILDEGDYEFQYDEEPIPPVSERQRIEERECSHLLTFCADADDPALDLEQLFPEANDGDMSLSTASFINKYDFVWISPIGAGAYSTVFKVPLKADFETGDGYEGSLPRYIVCRRRQFIESDSKELDAERARVWRELSIETMILRNEVLRTHENIVKLLSLYTPYGSWVTTEPPVLIYEYAELGCLSDFLSRARLARRMPVTQALFKLCTDVGSGLEALHSQQFAHLDLKPENILITRAGDRIDIVAKIADFGCAISSSVAYYAGGTPTWMAPEQLLLSPGIVNTVRFRDVARWDVYSFGMIVWYIFAAGKTNMAPRDLEFVTEARLKHDPMDLALERLQDSLENISWNEERAADASQLARNCVGHLVRHDPLRRDLGRALDFLDRPDSRIAMDRLLGEDFTLFLERLSRRIKVLKALRVYSKLYRHPRRWAQALERARPLLQKWRQEVANAPLFLSQNIYWPEVLLGHVACVELALEASRQRGDTSVWIGKALEIEQRYRFPPHLKFPARFLPKPAFPESDNTCLPVFIAETCTLTQDLELRFDREWCGGFFIAKKPPSFEKLTAFYEHDVVTVLGDTLAHYFAGSPSLLQLLRLAVEQTGCLPTQLNKLGISPLYTAFSRGNSPAAYYLLDMVAELNLSSELLDSLFLSHLLRLPAKDQLPLLTKVVNLCGLALKQIVGMTDSITAVNVLQQSILLNKSWLPELILDLSTSKTLSKMGLKDILQQAMESCATIHSVDYLVRFVKRWELVVDEPADYKALIEFALLGCPLLWSSINGHEYVREMKSTLAFLTERFKDIDGRREMLWIWAESARRSSVMELIPFLHSFFQQGLVRSNHEAWIISRFILWSLEHTDISSAGLALRHAPDIFKGEKDTPAFGFPCGLFPGGLFSSYIQLYHIENPMARRRVVTWLLENGYSSRQRDLPVLIIWLLSPDSDGSGSTDQPGPRARAEEEPVHLAAILKKAQVTSENLSYAFYALLKTKQPLEALVNAIEGLEDISLSRLIRVPPSAVGIEITGNSFLDLFITTPLMFLANDWKSRAIKLLARHLECQDLATALDHSDGLFLAKAVLRSDFALLDALISNDIFRSYISGKGSWLANAWIELDYSQASWDRRIVHDVSTELADAPFLSHDRLIYMPGPMRFQPDKSKMLEIEASRRGKKDYEALGAALRRFSTEGELSQRDTFMQELRSLVARLAEIDIRPTILHHCVFGITLEDAVMIEPSLRRIVLLLEVIGEVLQLIECRVKDTVPEQSLRFAINERWSLGAQYTIFYLLGSPEQRGQVEDIDSSASTEESCSPYRLTTMRLLKAQMKLQQLSTIFQAQTASVYGDEAFPDHIGPQERSRYRVLKALSHCKSDLMTEVLQEQCPQRRLVILVDTVARCRELNIPDLDNHSSLLAVNLDRNMAVHLQELEHNLQVALFSKCWFTDPQTLSILEGHMAGSHGLFLMVLLEAGAWLRRLQLVLVRLLTPDDMPTMRQREHLYNVADLKLRIAHALTSRIQHEATKRGLQVDPTQMVPRFLARLMRRENLHVSMPFHCVGSPPPGEDVNYLMFFAYHMYGHVDKALKYGRLWYEASWQAYRHLFHPDDGAIFEEEMDRKDLGSRRFASETLAEAVGQIDPAVTQLLCEVAEVRLSQGRRLHKSWTDEQDLVVFPILSGSGCDLGLHVLSLIHGDEPLGVQILTLLDGSPSLELAVCTHPGSLWARILDDLKEAPIEKAVDVLNFRIGSSLGLVPELCISVELMEQPNIEQEE